MSDFQLTAIGHIQSPYKQKFAIPRQPRLVPQAKAKLVFAADFNREEFVRGLDEFSHIWLLFRFHETADKGYSAMVRPPRLGGNERKGVFATRATFRPNAIGMSAVKLEGIEYKNGQLCLLLAGIDLLDGTPILDIKPYLPCLLYNSDAADDLIFVCIRGPRLIKKLNILHNRIYRTTTLIQYKLTTDNVPHTAANIANK